MKTTVCTQSHRVSVEPCPDGGVRLIVQTRDGRILAIPVMDLGQVGVLLFGLESAADQVEQRQMAVAA